MSPINILQANKEVGINHIPEWDFLSHVSLVVRKRLFLVTAAPSVMILEFQKLLTISYANKHYSSVVKISINNSASLGRYKGTAHRTRNQWQLMVMLVACTQTKVPLIHKYTQRHLILWKDNFYCTGNYYKNMLVVAMNSIKEIETYGQEKYSEQF